MHNQARPTDRPTASASASDLNIRCLRHINRLWFLLAEASAAPKRKGVRIVVVLYLASGHIKRASLEAAARPRSESPTSPRI